jgi:hypothetical protein
MRRAAVARVSVVAADKSTTGGRRLGKKAGGGRVTAAKPGRVTPSPSGRYTPPIPRDVKVSPRWVPVVMGAMLLLGATVIILNYIELLPGSASNGYLLVGLALITGGFITATQWH